MPTSNSHNVFIYVYPLVHLMGIAGPSQVFWEANALIPESYRLHFVSNKASIISAQGLGLSNIQNLEQVKPEKNDIIVIPGVHLNTYLKSEAFITTDFEYDWIREQYKNGVRLFSIGSATLILAKAGILDGKYCTTHWKCSNHLKQHYKRIKFIESKLFIKDQNIITSAGMSSNIDTTLAIIEEDHGPVLATKLALELLVYMRRFGNEDQKSVYLDYRSQFNPLVHQIQNIISSNLKKNYTNAALAKLTNSTERNITRVFKKTLNLTITDFKNKLRIDLANHLLNNKSLTLAQIAFECGYKDPRQLQRILKKHQSESS